MLAFLNSQQMRALLDGVNRSAIAGRLQPDDLRQISIPVSDDTRVTASISLLAQQASGLLKQLLPLRKAGWKITDTCAVAPTVIPSGIAKLPINRARVKWGLVLSQPDIKLTKLVRTGHRLFAGKAEIARIPSSFPEAAMEWLRRQLQMLPEGTTLGEFESANTELPATPELALHSLSLIEASESEANTILARIKDAKQAITDQLETLFERIDHPPIREPANS